ncbi:MAG: hypothetical protein J6X85_09165 [Ruminococcus sp.]|nr:hypothetical protein [Ruminococcus sp.]MBP5581935.1 hypothetical protein [Ruminococcus sp.]
MENNNIEMNKVIADFRKILEKRGIAYELNNNDLNMIRFRSQLPTHEQVMPLILIHFNDENGALSLALSRIAEFTNGGPDLYKVINDFNADPKNFACKMYVENDGQLVVLVNSIIKSEDVCSIIEEYIKIIIIATDSYYDRISELFENTDNN